MALDVTISIALAFLSLVGHYECAENALDCSDTWILGTTLDVHSSKENNASVSFTRIYLAKNSTQCSNDCCQQLNGLCDVAVFTETSTKRTCYHYECSPIEQCRFKRDNQSEVYLVSVSATENQSLSYLDEVTTPPNENASLRERPQGDGTKSKARKGALPDDLPVEIVPLKRDNTTVVPRKGVSAVTNPDHVDADVRNITKVTEVTQVRPPRPQSAVMEGQNTAVNDAKKDQSENQRNASSSTSEIPVQPLQVVFEGDNVTSYLDGTDNVTSKPAVVSTEKYFNVSDKSKSLHDNNLPPTITTETSSIEFHTGHAIMTSYPEEPIGANHERLTGKGVVALVQFKSIHEDDVGQSELVDGSDIAFRNSGSMHLVVGLVLGLLVLLSVFGIVGKRIHDSWLRRHYSRMDFLVDGMYHGDP